MYISLVVLLILRLELKICCNKPVEYTGSLLARTAYTVFYFLSTCLYVST